MPSDITAPVFVVGAPRSGTTMLAAMLGSHRTFAAGPETQFFSKLPLHTLENAVANADWPRTAIKLLMSLTLADQSVTALFETNAKGIEGFLADREPNVAAILEALTVPYAQARGKARWVEKTPNHILNLEALRTHWPNAAIVRILRDPRDVGLSTCKLPTFSDEILPNIYLWQHWNAQAESFLANDPLSMTVRYEDLVDDPEAQLKQICTLIAEEFDPNMIAFGNAAADVSSKNESWKTQVASGLTSSRKFAWKIDLPPKWRAVCDLVCHELLDAYGYETGPAPCKTHYAYRMSREYIEQQQDALRVLAQDAVRWMPCNDPRDADRVVDHPQYKRFRNPILLARLARGRAQARRERAMAI